MWPLFRCGDSVVRTFKDLDIETVISISHGILVNKRDGILECVGLS